MTKRHGASRRRSYGPRQRDVKRRPDFVRGVDVDLVGPDGDGGRAARDGTFGTGRATTSGQAAPTSATRLDGGIV